MTRAVQSIRKLPFVATAVVLVAAGASSALVYARQRAYVEARNVRLLAIPERSLVRSFGSDRAPVERNLWREGGELKVLVKRRASPARAGEPLTIRVADLLREVPLAAEAFDLLLAADDEGQVIAQVGDETLARQSLAGIQRAGGGALDAAELWNATQMVEAAVGGRAVALFCRPVVLPHEARGPGEARASRKGLLFCGLASEARVRGAALRISPLLVALLVGVVALTLLTPPFVKLFLLGRSERLRFADLYALVLSAFLGLLLLTVAILDVGFYASLRRSADDVLEAVAVRARDNLREELDRVRTQLRALDQSAARTADRCTNVFGLMGTPPPPGCPRLAVDGLDYPFFESVFWASPDGEQIARWRTDRRRMPLISVASREYFRAVRDGRLWRPRDGGTDGLGNGYFVEAVRSYSKGETRAALSMRSAGVPGALMTSMTTSLVSISQPVLPPRVGIAVIDPAGEVLFHSEPGQSLTHNLFAETGQDTDLRAAVASGASGFFPGRYWGQSHRFYTTPLGDPPWSVVAFRREDLLRGVNVQVLQGTACLVLLYALASFALPSLLYVAVARRCLGWLAPGDERGPTYAELSLSLLLALVVLQASLRAATPAESVAIAFLAPWVTLALVAAAFRLRVHARLGALLPPEASRRAASFLSRHYRCGHLAASLLFWTLFAVLPAVALTRASAERELQALAQLEDRHESADRARRDLAGEGFYGQPLTRSEPAATTPPADERLRRRRLDEKLDLYPVRLWSVRDGVAPGDPEAGCWGTADLPACDGWLCRALEAHRAAQPVLVPAAVELRYLPVVRVSCAGSRAGNGTVFAAADGAAGPGRVGPWPTFWAVVGPWPLACLLLLAAPAAAWIRWCARYLFRAELARPRPLRPEDLRQGLLGSAFCVVPSSLEADRLLDGGWCRRLSLRAAADGDDTCIDASRPLAVDLRGFREVDAPRREAVLECAEARVRVACQRVYLVATCPPGDLIDTPAGAPPLPPRESERWLRLFGLLPLAFVRPDRDDGEGEPAGSRAEQSARRLLGRSAGARRLRWLAGELRAAPRLRWLADHHLAAGAFEGVGRRETCERLAELGEHEYRALWNASGPDEKLALVHLCDEYFVNPRQAAAVSRLIDRGLVVRDPVLRPFNQSFAIHIRRSGAGEEAAAWERRGEGLAWSDLQMPVFTLAGVCALFLFGSHQDLLDTSVPLMSALGATGVPMLVKVANAVKDFASHRPGSAQA